VTSSHRKSPRDLTIRIESTDNEVPPAHTSTTTTTHTPPLSATAAPTAFRTPIVCDLDARYFQVRTLRTTMFGEIRLAFDKHRRRHVVIKASRIDLVTPRHGTRLAESINGVSVLEDVRREARILRLLTGGAHDKPWLIDMATCGVVDMVRDEYRTMKFVVDTTTLPAVRQISWGKRHIATLYDEIETPHVHCTINEFIRGGDLYMWQSQQPGQVVSEHYTRSIFSQLCGAVRYMHARSVAHTDLSLENVCMDTKGIVRVIDFGLAMQHPRYMAPIDASAASTATPILFVSANTTPISNCSEFIRLMDDPTPRTCTCASCRLVGGTVGTRSASAPPASSGATTTTTTTTTTPEASRLPFLCRPLCRHILKPGKLSYMSYELANDLPWDAYANDMFCLGVILFTMVVGRLPFTRQDPDTDAWFNVVFSGQWLHANVRDQPHAACYNRLSPNVLHLIDSLLKPQEQRPTISMVLKHPWFTKTHPGNAPN